MALMRGLGVAFASALMYVGAVLLIHCTSDCTPYVFTRYLAPGRSIFGYV